MPPVSVAVPSGAVGGTGGDASIDPGAEVAEDAVIGPGCRVGTGCGIEEGAVLWNSALEDCSVGAGVRVERSTVSGGSLGRGTVVISSRLERSSVGEGSTVESAAATDSKLAGPATVSPFADLKSVTADFGTILGGAFEAVDIDAYLMSMHMAGGCFHMRAVPRMVELDGRAAFVPAIPMLGGGSLIRGTEEEPVELECSFIGSNAIIEPGTFVGFGCFVLGRLGPRAGLLPFTVSTGGGAKRHQIGAVISAMASTAITHFVNWTFQAVGPEGLDGDGGRAVAEMMRQAIAEASAAIEWEVKRRASSGDFDSDSNPFHRYRSLPEYSDSQLESGLEHYRRALDDGAWDIQLRDGQLYFSSEQGHWEERGGAAVWRPKA